jgi:hypothetical protein
MKRTLLLLLVSLLMSLSNYTAWGQGKEVPLSKKYSQIKNSQFPKEWDKNDDLKDYKILCWMDKKDKRPWEYKQCLCFTNKVDSEGDTIYTFVEKSCHRGGKGIRKKSFTAWETHRILYRYNDNPKETVSAPKDTSGWRTMFHERQFDHKPSESDIYNLIIDWGDFEFFKEPWQTKLAGSDDNLWIKEFGFIPNRNWSCN